MDDYFFAFCISLPSIYPAPPHNATSAINASYDKVIIGKNPLSELRHNYHLCRLGLYSQIGENRPTVFSSTLWSIISSTTISVKIFNKQRIIKYSKLLTSKRSEGGLSIRWRTFTNELSLTDMWHKHKGRFAKYLTLEWSKTSHRYCSLAVLFHNVHNIVFWHKERSCLSRRLTYLGICYSCSIVRPTTAFW